MKQEKNTFEPAQHFLTLIKHHQIDIQCKELNDASVIQIHRKNVAMLAGILDKLQQ